MIIKKEYVMQVGSVTGKIAEPLLRHTEELEYGFRVSNSLSENTTIHCLINTWRVS